jgi:hypothetical protein
MNLLYILNPTNLEVSLLLSPVLSLLTMSLLRRSPRRCGGGTTEPAGRDGAAADWTWTERGGASGEAGL